MISFGRITVYPKQLHFLKLVYCLNYWVVGTHAPSLQPTEADSSTNSESQALQLQDDSQCSSSSQLGGVNQQTFCYCKGSEISEMVACDN